MSPEGHIEPDVIERASVEIDRTKAVRAGFREHRWVPAVMILSDIVMLELCLYLGWLTRAALNVWLPIPLYFPVYGGITAGVLVLPVAFYLMNLYPGYGIGDAERLRQQETGIAIVFSSLLIWDYLAQDGTWSRGILLATWLYAAILLPISYAYIRRTLIYFGHWGTPVMVVGARDAGASLIRKLNQDPKLGLRPVGVLDHNAHLVGSSVSGVPVLGTLARSSEFSRSVKICAVAMPELNGAQLAELSAKLPFPRIVLMPDFGTLQSTWIMPRDLGGVLGLELKKNLLLRHNQIIKRILDLCLCVPLFILVTPLLLFLCLGIFVVSPGNPVYRQTREGAGGKDFQMLKLRTMYPDADERLERYLDENPERRLEWERYFKLRDDPRILPVIGTFLRQSSLDELPQLLNVLKGEMSLVGPRPFPHYHLAKFAPEFRELRRSVPPGITGLWQVEVRSDGDVALQERHDSYYIRNWSLWLDILTLFQTIVVVVSKKGAR